MASGGAVTVGRWGFRRFIAGWLFLRSVKDFLIRSTVGKVSHLTRDTFRLERVRDSELVAVAPPALPKAGFWRDFEPAMGREPAHGTVNGGLGEAALLGNGPQRRVGTVARERLAVLSDDQGGQADGGKRDGSFTPKGMTKRKQSGQIILLQRELDYRPDSDVASIAGRADSLHLREAVWFMVVLFL